MRQRKTRWLMDPDKRKDPLIWAEAAKYLLLEITIPPPPGWGPSRGGKGSGAFVKKLRMED